MVCPWAGSSTGILEVSGRLLRVEQDPRDQKSGQDEEEVDAHPPVGEHAIQPEEGILARFVVEDHEKDGDASNAVELGKPLHAITTLIVSQFSTRPNESVTSSAGQARSSRLLRAGCQKVCVRGPARFRQRYGARSTTGTVAAGSRAAVSGSPQRLRDPRRLAARDWMTSAIAAGS
jgi:hypothetical protein